MSPHNYIGIDIGSKTFVSGLLITPEAKIPTEEFANTPEGFETFLAWLKSHQITPSNSIICMENTGVYQEALCYFLHAQGYHLVVEAPHKVKRAFHHLAKNDHVDAKQIAEYAYRFFDQLHFWEPESQLLAQIQTLLALREQFNEQLTSNCNILFALKKKTIATPSAIAMVEQLITELKAKVKSIDQQIESLFDQNPNIKQTIEHLISVPGVGKLLAYHLFCVTDGFKKIPTANQMAAYLGIAPHEYQSGTSIYRKPKSRQNGPHVLRKLLYLATMSLRTHNAEFKKYFLRKKTEGKNPKLILNNMANKLIRIICAVLKNNKVFIKNYKPVNPRLLVKTV